jgi:hypothetical protein
MLRIDERTSIRDVITGMSQENFPSFIGRKKAKNMVFAPTQNSAMMFDIYRNGDLYGSALLRVLEESENIQFGYSNDSYAGVGAFNGVMTLDKIDLTIHYMNRTSLHSIDPTKWHSEDNMTYRDGTLVKKNGVLGGIMEVPKGPIFTFRGVLLTPDQYKVFRNFLVA